MKLKTYLNIAIRIVFLCITGMLTTYITPQLRDFFGDTYYFGHGELIHDNYKWGARHYWYFWMMFCLFILSVVNLIISINKIISKDETL